MRLPAVLEGVVKGRISLNKFVALSSTNAARIYGMLPTKGTLAIGADADIAIWDLKRHASPARCMMPWTTIPSPAWR